MSLVRGGLFSPLYPEQCGSLKGGAYHYGTSIYYTDIYLFYYPSRNADFFMPLADSAGFFY